MRASRSTIEERHPRRERPRRSWPRWPYLRSNQKLLDELTSHTDLAEFLREGADTVQWQQFATGCVQMLALLGLSIVAGAAGGAAVRIVGGALGRVGSTTAIAELAESGGMLARAGGLAAGATARLAGAATETGIITAGQIKLQGGNASEAFFANLLSTIGANALLGTLTRDLAVARSIEMRTAGHWARRAGRLVLEETVTISAHTIMNVAIGYLAHMVVARKQVTTMMARDWLMQGISTGLGRYVGGFIKARKPNHEQLAPAKRTAEEQFLEDVRAKLDPIERARFDEIVGKRPARHVHDSFGGDVEQARRSVVAAVARQQAEAAAVVASQAKAERIRQWVEDAGLMQDARAREIVETLEQRVAETMAAKAKAEKAGDATEAEYQQKELEEARKKAHDEMRSHVMTSYMRAQLAMQFPRSRVRKDVQVWQEQPGNYTSVADYKSKHADVFKKSQRGVMFKPAERRIYLEITDIDLMVTMDQPSGKGKSCTTRRSRPAAMTHKQRRARNSMIAITQSTRQRGVAAG